MGRWISFTSTDEISLVDLVLLPSNSLVDQSIDAGFHPGFENTFNHQVNADGFGVGWYHSNNEKPAIFKDTAPAWSNRNLREICTATNSSCIMAHVRSATSNTDVSLANAHPFKAGRLLFCHNGAVQKFSTIRRALLEGVTDAAFLGIAGTTDSECCFAILLSFLERDGTGKSPYKQKGPFGATRLYEAMKHTIRLVEKVVKEAGIKDSVQNPTRLNFCLSDGESIVCSRWCDGYPKSFPPSLFFAYGDAEMMARELTSKEEKSYKPSHSEVAEDTDDEDHLVDIGGRSSLPGRLLREVDPTSCSFCVASEPLTRRDSVIDWHHVPANSILCYTRGTIPNLYKLKVLKEPKQPVLDGSDVVKEEPVQAEVEAPKE